MPARGHRRSQGASAKTAGRAEPENGEGAPAASEGQPRDWSVEPTPVRRRMTQAGWRDVLEGDPDPGSGFYRFAAKDIPGLPERNRMANTIECFGTDLANAHLHLRIVVAQARRVKAESIDVSAVQPVAHRATRLCKRARQARGEG